MTSCQENQNHTSSGQFSNNGDVGEVLHNGSVTYNSENQTYSIEGSGTNMWFGEDEFHFLWLPLRGDFILRAEAEFIGEGVDPHRKLGWMIRNNLETGSAHVNACVHGDGLTALQFRRTEGADTEEVHSADSMPGVIQLERRGNTYIMSTSIHGKPFTTVQVNDINLQDEVLAGLYVCSHNPDVIEKAVFRNVRIIKPAGNDLVPYQDYLGSNLEVMDIESRYRKILLTVPHSIQAPNWTIDGKTHIYNSKGLLYNYDLETGDTTVLNTGFANNNNNDHVLSFDGKQLAISHHKAEDNGQSTIYTLPVEGSSEPEQITSADGASYLHGWSPDATHLLFTGQRNKQFDIYKISIETKEEIQLTDTEGLDDGPEYSPDGKYIYFNSNRTGTMQIWRMKPDGSEPEQLTFDSYNDWFPHVSPDNKWIVFVSFPEDVPSGDHPFYKNVLLRLMPATGGDPEIIAYVYGGQGTINVPSWSPDSKKIAFVSNTMIRDR
jgi:TolB protein